MMLGSIIPTASPIRQYLPRSGHHPPDPSDPPRVT